MPTSIVEWQRLCLSSRGFGFESSPGTAFFHIKKIPNLPTTREKLISEISYIKKELHNCVSDLVFKMSKNAW